MDCGRGIGPWVQAWAGGWRVHCGSGDWRGQALRRAALFTGIQGHGAKQGGILGVQHADSAREATTLLRSFTSAHRTGCLGPRPSNTRRLADTRVSAGDQFAGAQSRLLEIGSVLRKHLPTCDILTQHLNRSHVRELTAQAFVVLFACRQPDAIVWRIVTLIAQY